MIGYTVLFNALFTFFLAYLNRKPLLSVKKFTNLTCIKKKKKQRSTNISLMILIYRLRMLVKANQVYSFT